MCTPNEINNKIYTKVEAEEEGETTTKTVAANTNEFISVENFLEKYMLNRHTKVIVIFFIRSKIKNPHTYDNRLIHKHFFY